MMFNKLMHRALAVAMLGASVAMPAFADEPVKAEGEAIKKPVQIIHAGQLLAVPGVAPKAKQSIIISDGRIAQIVPGYVDASGIADAEDHIVDLSDKFVLPGLMDMHVHLSVNYNDKPFEITGMSDESADEEKVERQDVAGLVEALGNAKKTIEAGYTTVRNVGSDGWNMFALKQAVDQGLFPGPRVINAGNIIRPASDGGSGACSGVEGCRLAVRRQIDMGADMIKIYASCSGSKLCGRKDAPGTFLPDELQAIVQTAHTRQMKVAAHSHSAAGVVDALNAGVDSIEHGSNTPPEAYALFKKNNAFLVPTLTVVMLNIRKELPTAKEPMRSLMQTFVDNNGPTMMRAWRAGVRIASGSDAGVTPHGKNALELEYYVEQGMPAVEALKTATVNAAELIGRSKDLGTLEAGKIADIIAVDSSPLDDIKQLQSVRFVMKDGEIVKAVAR